MANPVETSAASPLSAASFGDPSKLNFFNAREQDTKEYQDALQQSLTSLELRYAKPNWFKVAAGFAKPQLGGFMASLGSASEALGENVEQQRAAQLPIAQLRAQLALSKIGMGQSQLVAEKFKEWQDKGSNPEELMALRDFATATAPNAPVTAAITKRYDSIATERQLASADQANVLNRINTARSLGRQPDPADLARLTQYSQSPDYAPTQSKTKAEPFKSITDTDVGADYSLFSKLDNASPQTFSDLKATEPSAMKPPPAKKPSAKSQNELSASDKNQIAELLGAPNTKSPMSGKNPQLQPDQDASDEKYPVLHPYPDTTDMSNERATQAIEKAKERAKKQEEIAEGYVKNLAPYGDPTLFNPLMQSYKKTERLLVGNTTLANKVHDVLGTGNIMSQILKSVQDGGQVNIGGGILSGAFSLSLPAATWVSAGLTPTQASYANDLATEYIKQQLLKARMSGQNINQIPVAEFNTMLNANPNMNMRADASLGLIREGKYDALYQNLLQDQVQKEMNSRVDKNELAPALSVIRHSKKLDAINKAWNMQKKELAEQALERSKQKNKSE
jgi:hypothetical protein